MTHLAATMDADDLSALSTELLSFRSSSSLNLLFLKQFQVMNISGSSSSSSGTPHRQSPRRRFLHQQRINILHLISRLRLHGGVRMGPNPPRTSRRQLQFTTIRISQTATWSRSATGARRLPTLLHYPWGLAISVNPPSLPETLPLHANPQWTCMATTLTILPTAPRRRSRPGGSPGATPAMASSNFFRSR